MITDNIYHKLQKIITICFVIICHIISQGCTHYSEPKLVSISELPKKFELESSWWKKYNNHQLNKIISIALNNNLNIARSTIKLNKSLYELKLSDSDLFPYISGGTTSSINKNLKNSATSTRLHELSTSMQYEVDLWLKLNDIASAKQWEYLASREDIETVQLIVINTTIDTYFTIWRLNEFVRISNEFINIYTRLRELALLKYELGKSSIADVLKAEQSLLAARNDLLTQQLQVEEYTQILHNTLNMRPGEHVNLEWGSLENFEPDILVTTIPIEALFARPDVRAADYRVQAAFKNLSAAEKSWLPEISLSGGISSSSDSVSSSINFPIAFGILTIKLPFLDWNKVKWNIKISETEFEEIKISLEECLTQAANEIDYYHKAWRNTYQFFVNSKNKYKHDQRLAIYYKNRYEEGASDLADYLDALADEFSSKLTLLISIVEVIQFENAFYKSTGGKIIFVHQEGVHG